MTDEEKAEEYFCEHCENSFEHDNGHCSNCSKWDYFIAGLTEGRKEGYEQGTLKDCLKVTCPNCKPSIENYCINCEYANFIIDKDNQIYKLEKENEQLKCDLYNTDANLQHITIEYEKENSELKAKLPHWEDAKTSPTEPGWYLVYAYGEDQEEEPGVGMGYWNGTEWHAELDLEITVLQWTHIPKPEVTK